MHHTSLGEPGFVRETLKNVTVPEGRDVLLSCTVKNLDSHKVGNMKRNNIICDILYYFYRRIYIYLLVTLFILH